jgi:hypothetical protein
MNGRVRSIVVVLGLLLGAALVVAPASAAETAPSAVIRVVGSGAPRVGTPFEFEIVVRDAGAAEIVWPPTPRDLLALVLLESREPQRDADGTWRRRYVATAARSGELAIPPLPVALQGGRGDSVAIAPAVPLVVSPAGAGAPRLMGPPELLPPPDAHAPGKLRAVPLLIAFAILVWWWSRRGRPGAVGGPKSQSTSREDALEVRLASLAARSGEDGNDVIALADLARAALARVERFPAPRRTREETAAHLERATRLASADAASLRELLATAEDLKYGGSAATPAASALPPVFRAGVTGVGAMLAHPARAPR